MRLVVNLFLGCAAAVSFDLGGGSLRAQAAAARPPKLYALLVIDTDSNLAPHVAKDRDNLKRILREGFTTRPHRLELDVLEGPAATRERVLAYYGGLKGKVKPGDSLLFYYTGHGATFAGRGHCLTTHHDAAARRPLLARQEVRDAMRGLDARLTLLLTDCCSEVPGQTRARAYREPPKATWPVMDFLFFHHRGMTDINGCQENSLSWCYLDDLGVPRGGTFTLALVPLLCQRKENFRDLFGAEDGFVTWQQFSRKLAEDTDQWYQLIRKAILPLPSKTAKEKELHDLIDQQKKQDPQIHGVGEKAPQQIVDKIWLFGVEHTRAVRNKEPIVYVLKVYPGTPAATAGFQQGDVILAVDGRPTPTPLDFDRALEHSEGKVTIEYLRAKEKGSSMVTLKPVKPRVPE